MKRTRIANIAAWAWILGLVLGVVPPAPAAGPDWWIERGVVNTNAPMTNDFAPVNQGTVKWFATNAFDELEAYLPGGAGTNLAALVQSFSQTNNYRLVNQGQMKNLAKAFYDRLIAVGYTNEYPWTATTNDDASYQLANIGQVKNLFCFDVRSFDTNSDGMADWWELQYFGTLAIDPNVDFDGDGWTNLEEYQHLTDPTAFDTDGDGVGDSLDANPKTAADSDEDRLPDDWEIHWFGNLAQGANDDPDADGSNNLAEYRAGTDPSRGNTTDTGNVVGLVVYTPQQ